MGTKWKGVLEYCAQQDPSLREALKALLGQLYQHLQRANTPELVAAAGQWTQAKLLEVAGKDRCASGRLGQRRRRAWPPFPPHPRLAVGTLVVRLQSPTTPHLSSRPAPPGTNSSCRRWHP